MIQIPYFSQRDNSYQPTRTCFSSSVAMLLAHRGYVKSDEEYLDQVIAHGGDTTESSTHWDICTNVYGANPVDLINMSQSSLRSLLNEGIPVAIGILHKGPPSEPYGGHRLVVKGYYKDSKYQYIVNDPWGELMHNSGTYFNISGEGLTYSENILGSRWEVDGPGSGWGFYLKS